MDHNSPIPTNQPITPSTTKTSYSYRSAIIGLLIFAFFVAHLITRPSCPIRACMANNHWRPRRPPPDGRSLHFVTFSFFQLCSSRFFRVFPTSFPFTAFFSFTIFFSVSTLLDYDSIFIIFSTFVRVCFPRYFLRFFFYFCGPFCSTYARFVSTRSFFNLRHLLESRKHTHRKHVVDEHLPQAQHSTAQSALYKAAKHVSADQSATTEGSRQRGREPACRRECTARIFPVFLWVFL